jgi:sigma54-dependent transcription regulator
MTSVIRRSCVRKEDDHSWAETAGRVHRASIRARKPLVEAGLFGHERGSLTGAMRSQMGLVKRADASNPVGRCGQQ